MPTPVYTVRLAEADQKNLVEVSKLYGAPNPSVFLRTMVGALCSGNPQRLTDFMTQLAVKMGEQLTLDLVQKSTQAVEKPALPAKRKRKGAKRGRTT